MTVWSVTELYYSCISFGWNPKCIQHVKTTCDWPEEPSLKMLQHVSLCAYHLTVCNDRLTLYVTHHFVTSLWSTFSPCSFSCKISSMSSSVSFKARKCSVSLIQVLVEVLVDMFCVADRSLGQRKKLSNDDQCWTTDALTVVSLVYLTYMNDNVFSNNVTFTCWHLGLIWIWLH